MKKEYKTPTAEKVVFDYAESVVACPSGCSDPGHSWHSGSCYPACYHVNGNGNNNGGNQPSQPTNPPGGQNNNQYYAPGWGLGC